MIKQLAGEKATLVNKTDFEFNTENQFVLNIHLKEHGLFSLVWGEQSTCT